MIRLAIETDLHHLPEIEKAAAKLFESVGLYELFSSHTSAIETYREYMKKKQLWVAVADEKPVGFALASTIDNHAYLSEIDVHPHYGKRGIGKALVETVCEWAQEQGFEAITLSTQKNVAWNAPFYAKLGFEIMPPETWTAPYHELRAKEAELGLPVEDRVLMIKWTASQ